MQSPRFPRRSASCCRVADRAARTRPASCTTAHGPGATARPPRADRHRDRHERRRDQRRVHGRRRSAIPTKQAEQIAGVALAADRGADRPARREIVPRRAASCSVAIRRRPRRAAFATAGCSIPRAREVRDPHDPVARHRAELAQSGSLHALSVSATHVGTGHTVVFLSSAEPVPREWSRDPFVRHRAARIGPRHVLASAAIPMLFPAVKIGDEYFTDGGLRQNTPMSPAIRLGADRLLLVSLRYVAKEPKSGPARAHRGVSQAAVSRRQGAQRLLLDHTEYDLAAHAAHQLDPRGRPASFGDKFEEMMNRRARCGCAARRCAGSRRCTSGRQSNRRIAAQFVRAGRMKVKGVIARS